MRFFSSLLVGASAIVSLVSAQAAPSSGTFFTWAVPASVTVGSTYNVTYEARTPSSPVTIILRAGASNNLQTVATLTSGSTGGSFEWTVSKDLPNGADYALEIKQGSDDNYSKQFTITGSSATGVPGASSASSTGSATSSASGSSSASSTASASKNSTVTSATLTATAASKSSSSSPTSSGGSAPTGAAANLKSPMALVFGAVAAIAYLH